MLVLVGGEDFALASNLKVKENASENLVIGISCTHVAIKDPVTNKMSIGSPGLKLTLFMFRL